jgi:protein-L-isoaspartate(D-aspartate) O-methyltransferase
LSVLASKVRSVSLHTDATRDPAALRSSMVERLRTRGSIDSDEIERAFAVVPRHLFAPEATLDEVYDEDAVVRTKYGPEGICLSSVSAPHAQALMLKALGVQAGDRVVEYGSGGYNAALLAEVAGPLGQVTTVDIDEDVTDRAARFLEHAGYSRVRVALADAEGGVDGGPFERSLVTFGAWDIPPVWAAQMADGGVLTVPLRMAGLTRVVSFVKDGELLVSTDHVMFGFVPAQGAGAHEAGAVDLAEGISLEFDDGGPDDPGALPRALEGPGVEAWSGVTVPGMVPFDLLHLWLGFTLPGVARLSVAPKLVGRSECPVPKVMGPVASSGGSFAYLTCRPLNEARSGEPGLHEFGARGYGPRAGELAQLITAEVRAWDGSHRHGPPPRIVASPIAGPGQVSAVGRELVKRHTRIAVQWG